jgi:hypothetical protein
MNRAMAVDEKQEECWDDYWGAMAQAFFDYVACIEITTQ